MLIFPTGGGEATKSENMVALYASVWSWGTEEEEGNPFLYWKGVGEYRDPVVPNSSLANFADVLPEVSSLLYYCVERTLILDDINQDNNKVL